MTFNLLTFRYTAHGGGGWRLTLHDMYPPPHMTHTWLTLHDMYPPPHMTHTWLTLHDMYPPPHMTHTWLTLHG